MPVHGMAFSCILISPIDQLEFVPRPDNSAPDWLFTNDRHSSLPGDRQGNGQKDFEFAARRLLGNLPVGPNTPSPAGAAFCGKKKSRGSKSSTRTDPARPVRQ